MSGQQYVYSLEVSTAGTGNELRAVGKNRRAILRRAATLLENFTQTHLVAEETHHRDLTLLTFTTHQLGVVCDHYWLTPKVQYLGVAATADITIKAWVIKAAKPTGPVRGTLKERMGIESRFPTILLDDGDVYEFPQLDGRVT